MDFNTGSGGASPGPERPQGQRAPRPSGNEFTLSDPVGSFISTVRALVTNPVGFFRGIARQGDIVGPLVFALISTLISALIGGILGIPLAVISGAQDSATGAGSALVGSIVGLFVGLIMAAILTPIFLFIWAGITHLLVMLFVKPANAGFEATFRAVSYSAVTGLISWVPLIGGLVAAIWYVVLAIFGIRELHTTTTGKAALVVLIPFAVLLFIFLLLAIAIGAAVFTMLRQSGSL